MNVHHVNIAVVVDSSKLYLNATLNLDLERVTWWYVMLMQMHVSLMMCASCCKGHRYLI